MSPRGHNLVPIALGLLVTAGGSDCTPATPGRTESFSGMPICSTGTGSAVPECKTEFCAPGTLEIKADGATGLRCSGWGGSKLCQGNTDYQAFQYEDENVYLYFSFKPAITAGYSDESFRANFQYLWMNVYFPRYKTTNTKFFFQSSPFGALGDFERFQYVGGHLQARIHFPIARVAQEIQSMDNACYSGDIVFQCYCDYPASIDTVVELDLPVQS